MQLVVSATPGTGKSTITKNAEQYGLNHCHVHYNDHTREYELTVPNSPLVPVFDSDSSVFDKSEFPGNYIKHIKEVLSKFPDVVIFVSSHEEVRKAMAEAGIKYVLAYPERELKGDYLERYKERGSPEKFIALMDEKWNDFIDSVQADDNAERHLVLSEGEFLVDALKSELGAVTTKVDNVFPTAIITGTESIGDVVCDDVGQAVAVWGANGLEPLPSSDPVPDVVVVADPLAVATPDPVVDAPADADPSAVTPQPDFTTAIITGNESLGDTVYNDVGVAVAVVGEVGLEPIPVAVVEPVDTGIAPEVLVDVNAEPKEEPPAAMDPQDTPVPVTSIPEQMQSPEPVPPVSGQPAVDAPEVQAPATEVEVVVDPGAGTAQVDVKVDGQEDLAPTDNGTDELPPPAAEVPEALQALDRTELLEHSFTIEDDINTIQAVIEVCQTDKRDGLEGAEDGGAIFTQAAADIKQRYGKDVEPTLAGFEGFLDSLKTAFGAIGEAIKGKPNKEQLAKVKKYLYEAEKAFLTYGTDKWINSQKLINVGKVKLQVPAILKDVNSVSDVDSILKLINERVEKAFKNHDVNAAARVRAGLKVFNQFKKKPEDTDIAELSKELPLSPEKISTGGVADAGLNDLDTKFVAGEFPVLNADGIKELSKVVERIIDVSFYMLKALEGYEDKTLVDSDFWDSDFFDKHQESDPVDAVMACTIYERVTDQLQDIDYMYGQKLLNVCKFLEMWVLQSTK